MHALTYAHTHTHTHTYIVHIHTTIYYTSYTYIACLVLAANNASVHVISRPKRDLA